MATPAPLHADRGHGRTYTDTDRGRSTTDFHRSRMIRGHLSLHRKFHHLDGRDPAAALFLAGRCGPADHIRTKWNASASREFEEHGLTSTTLLWKSRFDRLNVAIMSELSSSPQVPCGWLDSLKRSKAQIAAGQAVPLLPVLDRLRTAAERLELEMGVTPDEASPNPPR